MRKGLLTMALLMWAATASAQQMAIRFYLVPKIGTGASRADAFRAKYIADWAIDHPGDPSIEYVAMDYGVEDAFLVAANVTTAQQTELAANVDVTAIPTPVSNNVSSVALTTVQNRLESAFLPGTWVTTSNTYAEVLRTTARVIQVMQRFSAMFGRLFQSGVTLNTTMSQLSAAQRQNLRDAASTLNVDTSGATGSTTIRDALLLFSQQIPPVTFTLAGQSFTF